MATLIGGYIFIVDRFDSRYASADTVQKQGVQIQQHIWQERYWFLKRQMREIEDRCGTDNPVLMPLDSRKRYDEYKIELEMLEPQLKNLGKP